MASTRTQPSTVGGLLADARERHGHSLRRAGDELGVTDRMYKQWEENFAKPGWDKTSQIARYTGTSRAVILVMLGIITPEEGALLRQMDGPDGAANLPDSVRGSSVGRPRLSPTLLPRTATTTGDLSLADAA